MTEAAALPITGAFVKRPDNMFLFNIPTEDKVSLQELDELLSQIKNGSTVALEQLYIKTKAAVYGFALSILKNQHQAEDVLQDTYIKIMTSSHLYKTGTKPMSWIMTITKNLALMKIREKNKYGEMPEHYEPSVDSCEVYFENKSVLNTAMSVLSSEETGIVIMHCVSGMKHREIADVMEMSLSTVLSKYNRALKKMKKALTEV